MKKMINKKEEQGKYLYEGGGDRQIDIDADLDIDMDR